MKLLNPCVFLFSLCLVPLQAQQSQIDNWIKDATTAKELTLAAANAMPAEHYSFKPNPEEMSFGEQLDHLARA